MSNNDWERILQDQSEQRWVTIKEAAEMFGCSVKSIRRRLDQRQIQGRRDGQYWKFSTWDLMSVAARRDEPLGPADDAADPLSVAPRKSQPELPEYPEPVVEERLPRRKKRRSEAPLQPQTTGNQAPEPPTKQNSNLRSVLSSMICKKDKNLSTLDGQNSNLSCSNIREAALTPEVGEQLQPRDAAVRLQARFAAHARRMKPKDPSTQDDLIQEMSLAVLLLDKPANRHYFLRCAVCRALNYLKYEELRGTVSLEAATTYYVHPADLPDEALLHWLGRQGVTPEQIQAILNGAAGLEDAS